jgi:hypothetical protein
VVGHGFVQAEPGDEPKGGGEINAKALFVDRCHDLIHVHSLG